MFMPPKPQLRDAEPLPNRRSALSRIAENLASYGADMAQMRSLVLTPAEERPDLKSRYARQSYRPGFWGDPL